MLRKSLVVTVLGVMLLASSWAAEIRGAGATSCGRWVEVRKTNDHYSQLNWVLGFISAYNHYVHKGSEPNGVFGEADHNALAVWLDNYCRTNPLSTLYKGAYELVAELRSRLPR